MSYKSSNNKNEVKDLAKQMKALSYYSGASKIQSNAQKQDDMKSRHSQSVVNNGAYGNPRNQDYEQKDESAGRLMHLVPCRWQKGGWKYVEVDPKQHQFFNNPNRINSTGFSPEMRAQIEKRFAEGTL